MVLLEECCYRFMCKGSTLHKLKGNERKYTRHYKLDATRSTLSWTPSRKSSRSAQYETRRIRKVKRGLASVDTASLAEGKTTPEGFTIVFSNGGTCELLAGNVETADLWIVGLRFLVHRNNEAINEHMATERERWLRQSFKNKSDGLPYLTTHRCIELLHDISPLAPFLNIQQAVYVSEDGLVSCSQFVRLFAEVTAVDAVTSLVFQYGRSCPHLLSGDELMAMLAVELGLVRSDSALFAQQVIKTYEPVEEYRMKSMLGVDGLIGFFLSHNCSAFNSAHFAVHQDMSQPLSRYWINASHNTFLTGSQLIGDSSADMYRQLLLKGVRFIDADLWDGPHGVEPFVSHGYTLTTRIPFSEVVMVIAESAFATSVYPVIFSIENHCSLGQQASVVQCLCQCLKANLYVVKDMVAVSEVPVSSLCCKVIVKCKKLSLYLEQSSEWEEVSDENSADEMSDSYKVHTDLKRNQRNDIVEQLMPYDQRRKQHLLSGKTPTIALSSELSSCVALKSAVFSTYMLKKNQESCAVYSIPEGSASNVVREQYLDMLSFTQEHLVCVTPSPNRIDSSNPDVTQFWNAGIQLVALNQQTDDRPNKMNHSLFCANGSCGYYLKPSILLPESSSPDFVSSKTMKIAFLHTSLLQSSTGRGNCFLRIEVTGHPGDAWTHYVPCGPNSYHKCDNIHIEYPDLAFIRVALYDEGGPRRSSLSDVFIPASSLASGVRVFSLTGPMPAAVFANIEIDERIHAYQKKKLGAIVNRRQSILGTIRSSLRLSRTDMPPTSPETNDKDSGFLSANSSPARNQLLTLDTSFGVDTHPPQHQGYDQDEIDQMCLDVLLEEAAKAEVLALPNHYGSMKRSQSLAVPNQSSRHEPEYSRTEKMERSFCNYMNADKCESAVYNSLSRKSASFRERSYLPDASRFMYSTAISPSSRSEASHCLYPVGEHSPAFSTAAPIPAPGVKLRHKHTTSTPIMQSRYINAGRIESNYLAPIRISQQPSLDESHFRDSSISSMNGGTRLSFVESFTVPRHERLSSNELDANSSALLTPMQSPILAHPAIPPRTPTVAESSTANPAMAVKRTIRTLKRNSLSRNSTKSAIASPQL